MGRWWRTVAFVVAAGCLETKGCTPEPLTACPMAGLVCGGPYGPPGACSDDNGKTFRCCGCKGVKTYCVEPNEYGACEAPADDLSVPDLSVRDFSTALNCGQIIDCTNNATSTTAFNKCIAQGTPTGSQLFTALDNCITMHCESLGQDAGLTDGSAGACGTLDTCISCVQSGQGKTHSNCVCMANNDPDSGVIDDPRCGQCVDALINCANDQ